MKPSISGHVAAGFEPVADAFRANFTKRGELGASFCVYQNGEVVVDLWGGVMDRESRDPWEADTLTTIFSSTKGLAATCLLMLADRGQLEYDRPVADYWPEFAQNGKAQITVRTLLNHRAGLVGIDEPLSIDDLELRPEKVAHICAWQAPHWRPTADQGYHGITFGLYAAELFRRVAGESIGRFLAREVAGPLEADVFIGLPESEEGRLSTLYPIETREKLTGVVRKLLTHRGLEGRVYRQALKKGSDTQRAFANPAELGARGLQNFNTRRVHQLELAWSNGIASARGLAKVYAALAGGGSLNGVRLVEPSAIEPLRRRQSWAQQDRVLRKPMGFSQGFIKEETHMFSPNQATFGHPGAGGSLGMADPDAHLGFAYVMNRMGHHIRSPRALALSHALYACVS